MHDRCVCIIDSFNVYFKLALKILTLISVCCTWSNSLRFNFRVSTQKRDQFILWSLNTMGESEDEETKQSDSPILPNELFTKVKSITTCESDDVWRWWMITIQFGNWTSGVDALLRFEIHFVTLFTPNDVFWARWTRIVSLWVRK